VGITRDNTTIYASDRDLFVFLADEEHRIEIGDRRNGEHIRTPSKAGLTD